MSDPRLNDPRADLRNTPNTANRMGDPALDPTLREPVRRGGSNTWAWIAGIAAVVLIAIFAMGNWNASNTPVTSNTPAVQTGSPATTVTPPSTTGSGASSPTAAPVETSPTPRTTPSTTVPAPAR